MFTILVFLVLGIATGCVFRHHDCTKKTETSTSATVALLIFTFGLSIGSHQEVMGQITSLGLPALLIALFATIGSFLAAHCYDRLFQKKGGQS